MFITSHEKQKLQALSEQPLLINKYFIIFFKQNSLEMWQVEYFHLFTEVHIILSVSTLRYNLHIVKTSQRVSRVCSVPSVTLKET